jgi:Rrf2 family protein
MLSTTSRYGVRALVYLARHGDQGWVPGRELAAATGIPPNYLAKVLQALRRAGLVRATRGLGGGYELARPADEILLGEVVEVLEGDGAEPCLLVDGPCCDEVPCAAHPAWHGVREAYLRFLSTTTVAAVASLATAPGSKAGVAK